MRSVGPTLLTLKKYRNTKRPVVRPHATEDSAPPLSPTKRRLFRILLALVLPAGLLGGLEIGLRLADYGYNPGFFKKIQREGKEYFISNENFTYRFFPPQLARWPDPFIFPAHKATDTFRVFVFGESAAMGDPQPAFGASRYLEMQLREKYPGKKIEMINLGITAINSHVILPIARECAKHEGDCWIIYMGNNEMVGPFGAATVFGAQALPRRLAQWNIALQTTRTGQLLVAGLRQLSPKNKNASWGGMEMFLENRIAPGDARKEMVYQNFERNLRDIVSLGVNSGAKVILNTMSVNLKDCPPFSSFLNTNLPAADRSQVDAAFARAKVRQAEGDLLAATAEFAQVVKLDTQNAEAHFRLAQCELALTNPAAADEFQKACDTDALPFRSDSRINRSIRRVAQEFSTAGVRLCDAEKELALTCPTHIAGDEIFFEHVHFNFDGNYQLGKIWAEAVMQVFPSRATNVLSQAECEQQLGLSIWNRQFVLQSIIRRMGVPPLNSQFNNETRRAKVGAAETQLLQSETQAGAINKVRTDFKLALTRAPNDNYLYEGLANFLEATKDIPGAIDAYRRASELTPAHFYAEFQRGRLFRVLGRFGDSQSCLEVAAQLRPSLPEGWFELASTLSAQKKYSAALDSLVRAEKLRPQNASYVYSVGQMLAKLERQTEAVENYRRAIKLDPGYWQVHFELANELVASNQFTEAIAEYNAVIQLNPKHVPSYLNLGVLLVRINRLDEAIQCFQTAVELEPENPTANEYLTSAQSHKRQAR